MGPEEKVEKILEIRIDTEKAIKSMTDLTAVYDELKNKEATLKQSIKDLNKEDADYADNLKRLRAELLATKEAEKDYAGQISNVSRAIQDQLKIDNEQLKKQAEVNGSLKDLRAELSRATKEYDNLSRAEREGAKGVDLKDHINTITNELKGAEEGTQRFQRNVGNYKSALQGATGALKIMGVGSRSLDLSLKALNANPIVAFFTALATIATTAIAIFKEFEKRASDVTGELNKMNKEIDNLNSGLHEYNLEMEYAIKLAQAQGASEMEILKLKEKQAAQAASTASAVVNKYYEELDVLREVEKKYGKLNDKQKEQYETAQSKLKEALAAEKTAYENWTKATQDITIQRVKNEKAAADKETKDKEDALKKQTEDFKKAEKEKKDAADKAQAAIVNATKETQDALISLMKDGAEKETALENARFEKQRASLQAKLDAEKNANGEETELYLAYAAQMEAIEQQHQDKLNKISLQGRQKDVEQEMKTIQMKLDLLKDNLEQEYELKRQMLDKQLELELSKTEYTEEQKLLIKQKYDADVIALEEQKNQAVIDQTNLEWQNRIEAMRMGADEYLENSLEALSLEMEQAKESFDNIHQYEYETDAEYKARLLAAQKNYLNKKKQLANAEMQIEKAKAQAAQEFAGSMSEMLETVASDNEVAVGISKTLALAEVAIKQGIAIAEAVASAAAGDPYTYALRVAAAIASTITAMTKAITSINSAKFAKGTSYVNGPGTETSDSIPAWLSRGEGVVTARANKMFPGLVQAMNDVAAGVSTPARVFNSSNVVNNYTSQSTLNEIAENTEKRLVVSVEEIHRVEDNVEAIENLSTL